MRDDSTRRARDKLTGSLLSSPYLYPYTTSHTHTYTAQNTHTHSIEDTGAAILWGDHLTIHKKHRGPQHHLKNSVHMAGSGMCFIRKKTNFFVTINKACLFTIMNEDGSQWGRPIWLCACVWWKCRVLTDAWLLVDDDWTDGVFPESGRR